MQAMESVANLLRRVRSDNSTEAWLSEGTEYVMEWTQETGQAIPLSHLQLPTIGYAMKSVGAERAYDM